MWNGIELSYPLRRAIEEYREKIREADHDYIFDLVQEIATRADDEIKEKEETREYFADLAAEIAKRADNIIKRKNAQKQAVPYAVHKMVPMLLGAVEGHFLQKDNDEKKMEENLVMQEDKEPKASLTDSWACNGSAPVQKVKEVVLDLESEKSIIWCKVGRKVKDWEIAFRNTYLCCEIPYETQGKELPNFEVSYITEEKKKVTLTTKKTSFARRLFGRKTSLESGSKEQKKRRLFRMLSSILPCFPKIK